MASYLDVSLSSRCWTERSSPLFHSFTHEFRNLLCLVSNILSILPLLSWRCLTMQSATSHAWGNIYLPLNSFFFFLKVEFSTIAALPKCDFIHNAFIHSKRLCFCWRRCNAVGAASCQITYSACLASEMSGGLWNTSSFEDDGKIQAWSAVDLFWVCYCTSLAVIFLKIKKKKRENTALKYSDRTEEEKLASEL